jgi:uncharacterized membrane-anchored protein
LAITFAPFLGYLAFGLLFLPMWLLVFVTALIQGDPEVIHVVSLLLLMLGGLAGTVSMYHVVRHVYGLPARKRDARWVMAGILAGLCAIFYSVALFPVAWFAVSAAVLSGYLVYLDREYLFAGPGSAT